MKSIIFYGAGRHSLSILGEFSDMKVFPSPPPITSGVCFADSDPLKHGKIHLGLPVVSLEQALNEFSDAEIYLSIGDMKLKYEICCHMEEIGIRKERIINYVTYRLSCPYLEHFIVCGYHEGAFSGSAGHDCGNHSLKSCCSDYGKNHSELVPIESNITEAFDSFIRLRDNTIKKLNMGEPTKCDGCHELKRLYTPLRPYFKYLIYNELGRCNCKCVYCNYEERLGRNTSVDTNFVDLMQLVKEYGFDNFNGFVELCNGEITINSQKRKIYDELKDKNIMFLTNGIVYDEEIKFRLMNGTGVLNISLDCGTKETFKKVKGVDCFDNVIDNLKKYCNEKKGELYLKYILLPGFNDNIIDIDGFIDLCICLKVTSVHISHNLCLTYKDYSNEQTIFAAKYMVERLKAKSLKYELYSQNIIQKIVTNC